MQMYVIKIYLDKIYLYEIKKNDICMQNRLFNFEIEIRLTSGFKSSKTLTIEYLMQNDINKFPMKHSRF